MDTSLLHAIIQLRRPWLDDVMLVSSALGAAGFIWWVAALITGIFPNKRAAAWRLLLTALITWGTCEYALKPLFDRARPFEVDSSITVIDAKPLTRSFPSGHAAIAVAGAIAASRMLPGTGIFWWLLASVVAVSRIYIGLHWPSDVAAGALVGVGIAWFVLGGKPNLPPKSAHSAL
jgi:undecaprenyl-diphosphatase